jgi:hypothetical protein
LVVLPPLPVLPVFPPEVAEPPLPVLPPLPVFPPEELPPELSTTAPPVAEQPAASRSAIAGMRTELSDDILQEIDNDVMNAPLNTRSTEHQVNLFRCGPRQTFPGPTREQRIRGLTSGNRVNLCSNSTVADCSQKAAAGEKSPK